MQPDDKRHGTYAGANAHWHSGTPICEPCKKAATVYHKVRKLNILAGKSTRVPITGTRRRIRALCALGWSYNQIGQMAGFPRENVRRLATDEARTHVTVEVANKIARVYDEKSMTLPDNTNRRLNYFRNKAKASGWLPPLAWDDIDTDPEPSTRKSGYVPDEQANDIDEVAIQRFLSGDKSVTLTRTERYAVFNAWRAEGRPLSELERRTGWNTNRMRRQVAA